MIGNPLENSVPLFDTIFIGDNCEWAPQSSARMEVNSTEKNKQILRSFYRSSPILGSESQQNQWEVWVGNKRQDEVPHLKGTTSPFFLSLKAEKKGREVLAGI